MKGLEPSTFGATIRCSSQLSYNHRRNENRRRQERRFTRPHQQRIHFNLKARLVKGRFRKFFIFLFSPFSFVVALAETASVLFFAVNRQPATGNRQPATGNRQPSTGNRQTSTGNRQPATGNRQTSTGNRQPATVKRQTANGKRQTANANRQPPNVNRQPSTVNRQTPNAKRQTPNAKRQTPTAKRQTPTANRQPSTAKRQTPRVPVPSDVDAALVFPPYILIFFPPNLYFGSVSQNFLKTSKNGLTKSIFREIMFISTFQSNGALFLRVRLPPNSAFPPF